MYSEKLETFIDLILADGEITEKEYEVLHRKAAEEGIDPDEIDIVVEGRLAKMQNEQKKAAQTAAQAVAPTPTAATRQNTKHGTINKCPSCGTIIEAGSIKCGECGYTFRNIDAVSSVERFSQIILQIESESSDNILSGITSVFGLGMDKRTRRLQAAIQSFPIPNAKEDLLEFLMYLKPKTATKSGNQLPIQAAYKAKYDECEKKAKLYFKDDPQFRELLGLDKKGLFGKLFGK